MTLFRTTLKTTKSVPGPKRAPTLYTCCPTQIAYLPFTLVEFQFYSGSDVDIMMLPSLLRYTKYATVIQLICLILFLQSVILLTEIIKCLESPTKAKRARKDEVNM